MKRTSLRASLAVLSLFLAVACAPGSPAVKSAPGAAALSATHRVPTHELHWVRGSAEYRAITIQTYRAALEAAAKASAGKPAGSWAVAVDADETIIDNSRYESELQQQGLVHTEAAWRAWVHRRERPAIPGAAAFLVGVRKLGGRIAVVSNTEPALRDDLAANLDALGLPYDVLLCLPADGGGRKEGRWKSVSDGTARPGLLPVEILVWVGDNIQDFPDQSQTLRDKDEAAFGDFGVRFFALPNPIYGSWEKNAPR